MKSGHDPGRLKYMIKKKFLVSIDSPVDLDKDVSERLARRIKILIEEKISESLIVDVKVLE